MFLMFGFAVILAGKTRVCVFRRPPRFPALLTRQERFASAVSHRIDARPPGPREGSRILRQAPAVKGAAVVRGVRPRLNRARIQRAPGGGGGSNRRLIGGDRPSLDRRARPCPVRSVRFVRARATHGRDIRQAGRRTVRAVRRATRSLQSSATLEHLATLGHAPAKPFWCVEPRDKRGDGSLSGSRCRG
jgi:hypothetical protein